MAPANNRLGLRAVFWWVEVTVVSCDTAIFCSLQPQKGMPPGSTDGTKGAMVEEKRLGGAGIVRQSLLISANNGGDVQCNNIKI